ncbi:class I SAM-dependent methyltransferase [Catellatospora tritici]|uniref:class I SAM-dependent methyltransferase n=1 Tax=Catellatospora tritici TaxID=2851566 RepID=UPI001C2DD3D0|nr:class I SAM-dependent methyltransferase [Catellatospora tritici]MBV1853459.1 class I SAM-dependent methyltransferase [Catellatospora tritici]
MTRLEQHRLSFGAAAQTYAGARPTYPLEALDWALDSVPGKAPLRVVDLAAGTGQLTRVVLAAGHDVVAVEPDPEMRAQLTRTTPGVDCLAGSAEAIPLADGSADAVVVGTAFHWFDPVAADTEIARVLRPGGVLAPMWNNRDLSLDWTRRLEEIITPARQHLAGLDTLRPSSLFEQAEVAEFPHSVRQTAAGLLDLVQSRSWYLTAAPEEQRQILDQVRTLCATHPDLAGRDSFELPYTTVAYRLRRR